MSEWPLVGRSAETSRLQAILEAGGGRGFVIAGPAGAGKTSLARWCADHAVPLGYDVQWVFGTEATADIPLGAFAPLLPALGSVHSAEALLQVAHRVFRGTDSSTPRLLAVDDSHLLDDISALLVHQLATAGMTTVVLTLRSGGATPEPLVELWKDAHIDRVELAPLTGIDVDELLAQVLGGVVDMATSHALWRASGGNPLYLRELFSAAREQHLLDNTNGTWRLTGPLPASPRLVDLVESRLAGLRPEARETVELLAFGEPLRLSHVEALVDVDVLTTLESAGIVTIETVDYDESVRLAHPLYGEVLRTQVPVLRARQLRRRLAEAMDASMTATEDDRDRAARWHLESGTGLPADRLLSAAVRALHRFDLAFARRCATTAHQAAPSTRSGLLVAQILELEHRHAEAEEVLAELAGMTSDDDELVEAARIRADGLYHRLDRPDEARRVSLEAEGRIGAQDARDRLVIHRAWLTLFDGDPSGALAAVVPFLGGSPSPISREASPIAARSCMAAGRFRQAKEYADRAAGARGGRATLPELPLLSTGEVFILLHSGRLDDALMLGITRHREAIESGAVPPRGWFAQLIGWTLLLQGRPASASRWFAEAVTAMTLSADYSGRWTSEAGEITCLALLGDAEGARSALHRLKDLPGRHWPLFAHEETRAVAWTQVAEGDVPGARQVLLQAADSEARGGAHTFESALLHDVVRLGSPPVAAVERLEELATLVEGDLSHARGLYGRAALDQDVEALTEVSGAFARLGAMLFAAEAAALAATVAHRHGGGREVTALTRTALDLAERCEGAKTPALAGVAAGQPATPLTDRELEIARLAAAGASSKTIAADLFLSARTVDNYLGRVFTKLGITSRAQLAEALGQVP